MHISTSVLAICHTILVLSVRVKIHDHSVAYTCNRFWRYKRRAKRSAPKQTQETKQEYTPINHSFDPALHSKSPHARARRKRSEKSRSVNDLAVPLLHTAARDRLASKSTPRRRGNCQTARAPRARRIRKKGARSRAQCTFSVIRLSRPGARRPRRFPMHVGRPGPRLLWRVSFKFHFGARHQQQQRWLYNVLARGSGALINDIRGRAFEFIWGPRE